ncbi:MAG: ParA family protein [Pseudomonadota bacterium]
MSARRIAFINEKGGSCKTTLAVNIAAYLATEARQRVLLVDLDPQGQAGKALGLDVRRLDATMRELLVNDTLAPGQVVQRTRLPDLDVVASNKRLADWPLEAAAQPRRELLVRDRLRPLFRSYDTVIFDSPPSLGLFSLGVMLAAEEIVIPVPMTYLGLDGCAEIVDTVQQVRDRYQHTGLRVSLVVPTLYRPTRLADEILTKLRGHFGDRVSRTVMSYNVRIDEAQSHGKSIWEYAPRCSGAVTLRALCEEIVALQPDASPRASAPPAQATA